MQHDKFFLRKKDIELIIQASLYQHKTTITRLVYSSYRFRDTNIITPDSRPPHILFWGVSYADKIKPLDPMCKSSMLQ